MNVEQIWTQARDRYGIRQDWRKPPPAAVAALTVLAEKGTCYGAEIARLSGANQSKVCRALQRLEDFRFAQRAGARPILSGRRLGRGGKPAEFWRLTPAGQRLVAALHAEGGAE